MNDSNTTRRAALFGALLLPANAYIDETSPLVTTGITISPGIFIDGKTGNVTVPEGLSLTEASKAFWSAVQENFPSMRCHER